MTAPRWLELQFEIDYEVWLLNEHLRTVAGHLAGRSAMDLLVDDACGYETKVESEVREWVARIKVMQDEFYRLVGDPS